MNFVKLTGASLLFLKKVNGKFIAELRSYILSSKTYDDFFLEVNTIGNNQNENNSNFSIEYLGVEDIFAVIGPIGNGALLGRTTIWEQTEDDAKEYLVPEDKYTYVLGQKDVTPKWYLLTGIFHVTEKVKSNSKIIFCLSVLSADITRDIYKNALSLFQSEKFIDRLIFSDYENFDITNLKFIGIEDIVKIPGDIFNKFPFENINKEFNSTEEIVDLLATEEEIKFFFE